MENDPGFIQWLEDSIRALSQNLNGYLQTEGVNLWLNELSSFKKKTLEKAFAKVNLEHERMPKLKKMLYECNQIKYASEGKKHVRDLLNYDQRAEYDSFKHGDKVRIHADMGSYYITPMQEVYDGVIKDDDDFKLIDCKGDFKLRGKEKVYSFVRFLHEAIKNGDSIERVKNLEPEPVSALDKESHERFKAAIEVYAKMPARPKPTPPEAEAPGNLFEPDEAPVF